MWQENTKPAFQSVMWLLRSDVYLQVLKLLTVKRLQGLQSHSKPSLTEIQENVLAIHRSDMELFIWQANWNQGWAKCYTVKSNKIKSLYDYKLNSYYFSCEPVNRSSGVKNEGSCTGKSLLIFTLFLCKSLGCRWTRHWPFSAYGSHFWPEQ